MKQVTIMQCNNCDTKEIMDPLWASLDGQDSKDFMCGWCDAYDSHITVFVPKAQFDKALEALKHCLEDSDIGHTLPYSWAPKGLASLLKELEETAP